MKPKVYLETSFISYLTGKLSSDLTKLQRQLSSQRWWADRRQYFDLFASQILYKECLQGNQEAARERSAILHGIPVLSLNGRILEIAKRLVEGGPFPKKADTDATHLAIATVYGCEYLLTWNFKHINNAQIKRAATEIIQSYGYKPTTICTPEELMGSNAYEG